MVSSSQTDTAFRLAKLKGLDVKIGRLPME